MLGALFALTAVVLGALGAHALKSHLEPSALESFKTGVRYQAWHAFALLFLGLAGAKKTLKNLQVIGWFFSLGILLFSVSIYLLSTQSLTGINFTWLGPITPIGGLLLITGWAILFYKIARTKNL